jgi:cyanophycin synthetase
LPAQGQFVDIEATAIYSGPNVHSPRPLLRQTLRLPRSPDPARVATLVAALERALPGLRQNPCPRGTPGGFGPGTPGLEHLFEHACLELQRAAGAEVECVRHAANATIAAGDALVAYEEAEVGVEAARVVASWFTEVLESGAGPVAFEQAIQRFHEFSERHTLPVQDRVLMRTARARGIPATRLIGRVLQLGHGCRQERLSATKTTRTNVVSNDISANKDYTRRLLGELGLPMPRYRRVYSARAAVEAAEQIGYPVVVKPNHGSMGAGVSISIKNARDVRAAYRRARELSRAVLVEELIAGSDYRLLVVDGKLCAAARRVPAHVVGDGNRTVVQLVEQVNQDPRRGDGSRSSWTRIVLDDRADRLLAELGHTRESIPSKGEIVHLRRNANTSDGGTALDVTDQVHPDNRDIAIRAAIAVGLDVAGVDLLTTDIARSIWESGGVVCEINSRPGIRKHLWPAEGRPRDVTGPIVDMLFPPGTKSRIPIATITGLGDRHGVASALARVLADSGLHIGLVTLGQLIVGGRSIDESLTLPRATRKALMDPMVEALVIDAAPEDVWVHGLGHDASDVCVIVEADPPREVPPAMAQAIGVVERTALPGGIVRSPQAAAVDGRSAAYAGAAATLLLDGKADVVARALRGLA